jgi:hypothetical protein
VRQLTRLTGVLGFGLAVALVTALTGCAEPEYRFVGSDDHDVVMRMPRDWAQLNTSAAMKAGGIDPTTAGWIIFYDAAAKPVVAHVKSVSTTEPFLYAQSIPIGVDQRATLTDDQLREVMLPGTPELRAQATKAKDFAMLANETISKPKQHGVHLRYSFNLGRTTEIYDRIALTDPKHTAVHILFVHCTQECFAAHPEIDDVVSSLTLKSH